MRRALILTMLAISPCAFAQGSGTTALFQGPGAAQGAAVITARSVSSASPVVGEPYSATVSSELMQTLADGNRIVQSSSGTIARDSQGRIRQDAPLPAIGGLAPANAPHLVFIQDPVAQVSYTLNLTDQTAQKMPLAPGQGPGGTPGPVIVGGPAGGGPQTAGVAGGAGAPGGPGASDAFFVQVRTEAAAPLPPMPPPIAIPAGAGDDQSAATTEDLGSQTMEGIFVAGTRTTRTIPAGQIGNDRPISIVTEVWTSPDLKTIVYSKRSDPRIGEQTFQLKGISRAEPDASLFTVPANFKVSDGPQPFVFYRSKE